MLTITKDIISYPKIYSLQKSYTKTKSNTHALAPDAKAFITLNVHTCNTGQFFQSHLNVFLTEISLILFCDIIELKLRLNSLNLLGAFKGIGMLHS